MANITNGSVTYERRTPPGEYGRDGHRQAAVVIHYVLDDGEDIDVAERLIARAGQLATQHVYRMLRAGPSNGSAGGSQVADPVAGPQGAPAGVATGHGPAQSGAIVDVSEADPIEVPPASVEVAVLPPAAPVTNLKAAKRAAAKKASVDPVVIDHETLAAIDEDFAAVAPAPTDAELGQVLSRVNGKLKDRDRILRLVGEFVQSGQSYTQIPAVRRSEFLTKLEALV